MCSRRIRATNWITSSVSRSSFPRGQSTLQSANSVSFENSATSLRRCPESLQPPALSRPPFKIEQQQFRLTEEDLLPEKHRRWSASTMYSQTTFKPSVFHCSPAAAL